MIFKTRSEPPSVRRDRNINREVFRPPRATARPASGAGRGPHIGCGA